MQEYFGIITIGEIENIPPDQTGAENSMSPFEPLDDGHIRVVHYPDCQQLIIWLPRPGSEYGKIGLLEKEGGAKVAGWMAEEKLNGSIQLLWDTLFIKPGEYVLEICKQGGGLHRVGLRKYEAGAEPETEKQIAANATVGEDHHEPIVYRDGFGNIIPDTDLEIREKALRSLAKKFGRRIEYEGTFRAGIIIYTDGETRIEFPHEMGGGNCMFYIDVPGPEKWEAQTGTPAEQRQEILEFVAATVRSRQAPRCRYEISNDSIGFYYT